MAITVDDWYLCRCIRAMPFERWLTPLFVEIFVVILIGAPEADLHIYIIKFRGLQVWPKATAAVKTKFHCKHPHQKIQQQKIKTCKAFRMTNDFIIFHTTNQRAGTKKKGLFQSSSATNGRLTWKQRRRGERVTCVSCITKRRTALTWGWCLATFCSSCSMNDRTAALPLSTCSNTSSKCFPKGPGLYS